MHGRFYAKAIYCVTFLLFQYSVHSTQYTVPEASFIEGISLYKAKQLDLAITHFLSLAKNPTFPLRDYCYYMLGRAYFNKGAYVLSTRYFERLLNDHPTFVHRKIVYPILADAYFLSHQFRKAAFFYNQHHKEPLIYAAYSYERAGNNAKAILFYKTFWRGFPRHVLNSFALERIYALKGALDDHDWYAYFTHEPSTHRQLKGLLNLLPKTSSVHLKIKIILKISKCYDQLGDGEKAVTFLKHYYEEVQDPRLLYEIARFYAKRHEFQDAIWFYNTLIQKFPGSPLAEKALYLKAALYLEKDNYKMAQHLFKSFLEKYPRSTFKESTAWYWAWSYYLDGDYTQARSFLQNFLKTFPQSELTDQVKYWLGKIALQEEKKEEADAYFTELINKNPWSYYGILASSLSFRGGPERATEEWRSFASAQDDKKKAQDDKENGLFLQIKNEEHLQKGLLLKKLGLKKWASAELYRVYLKNRRDKRFLLKLSELFFQVGDYFLAHSISEIHFSNTLEKPDILENEKVWKLAFPLAYEQLIFELSKKLRLDPHFVFALMKAESNFRPRVISKANAYGLMQLIVPTAKEEARKLQTSFKTNHLFDPQTNILLGTNHLKHLFQEFEGNQYFVISSYNAGFHRVREWRKKFDSNKADQFVEQIPFRETRHYMKKVLRNYFIYKTLYPS